MKYCGLNPRDLLILQGKLDVPLPFVPGYEVAGEVLERVKGEEDDSENPIEVGDSVVALTKSSLGGLSSHCIALEKVGLEILLRLNIWIDSKIVLALTMKYVFLS